MGHTLHFSPSPLPFLKDFPRCPVVPRVLERSASAVYPGITLFVISNEATFHYCFLLLRQMSIMKEWQLHILTFFRIGCGSGVASKVDKPKMIYLTHKSIFSC